MTYDQMLTTQTHYTHRPMPLPQTHLYVYFTFNFSLWHFIVERTHFVRNFWIISFKTCSYINIYIYTKRIHLSVSSAIHFVYPIFFLFVAFYIFIIYLFLFWWQSSFDEWNRKLWFHFLIFLTISVDICFRFSAL